MDKNHIQTFVALAERARGAGLISFQEMPAVLQAISAANEELKATPEAAPTESKADGKDIQAKTGERKGNG